MTIYKVIKTASKSISNGSTDAGSIIHSGSWYQGHSNKSSFFRPTNLTYGARYMGCRFGVKAIVVENQSNNKKYAFVSINGGYISTSKMVNNVNTCGWPKAFLAASLKKFTLAPATAKQQTDAGWKTATSNRMVIKSSSGTNVINYNDKSSNLVSGVTVFYDDFGIFCKPWSVSKAHSFVGMNSAKGSYSDEKIKEIYTDKFPQAKSYSKQYDTTLSNLKSTLSSKGYEYIGEISVNSNNEASIYISGCCLFNTDIPGSSAPTEAYEVTFKFSNVTDDPGTTEEEEDPYYPWARVQSNGDFVPESLNSGFLKRFNGSSWIDTMNQYANNSHTSWVMSNGLRQKNQLELVTSPLFQSPPYDGNVFVDLQWPGYEPPDVITGVGEDDYVIPDDYEQGEEDEGLMSGDGTIEKPEQDDDDPNEKDPSEEDDEEQEEPDLDNTPSEGAEQ